MLIVRKGSRKIIAKSLNLPPFSKKAKIRFFLITLSTLLVDQLSKLFVLNYTAIVVVKNKGIAFGVFSDIGLLLVVLTLILLVFYFIQEQRTITDKVSQIGFALIVGGGISNLLDRLRLGYVVDFISVPFWPKFNLADLTIVIGVAVMVIRMIDAPKRQ